MCLNHECLPIRRKGVCVCGGGLRGILAEGRRGQGGGRGGKFPREWRRSYNPHGVGGRLGGLLAFPFYRASLDSAKKVFRPRTTMPKKQQTRPSSLQHTTRMIRTTPAKNNSSNTPPGSVPLRGPRNSTPGPPTNTRENQTNTPDRTHPLSHTKVSRPGRDRGMVPVTGPS